MLRTRNVKETAPKLMLGRFGVAIVKETGVVGLFGGRWGVTIEGVLEGSDQREGWA